ncbi:MAG: PEP-CTERM sorting domain-containing protein [bacterium]|nr:PEP-CTERM sorting domain-containing protein [bacterium]
MKWFGTMTLLVALVVSAAHAQTYSVDANGLPILNSNSGAAGTVYLDFDGGDWAQGTCTPYGGDTTFDTTEQTAIYNAWKDASIHFAMFDLNVTTVLPNKSATPTAHLLIGDGGAVNNAAIPNTYGYTGVYATGNVLAITTTNRSTVIAHEVGHILGLNHQARYDSNGDYVSDYRTAAEDQWDRGVLMGRDYDGKFAQWSDGLTPAATESEATSQDDVAVIAANIVAKANAFTGDTYSGDGFRIDDHGGVLAGATIVTEGITEGIIERTADVDMFRLYWNGGVLTVSAEAQLSLVGGYTPEYASSVGLDMTLYDATGTALSSDSAVDPADVDTALSESLSAGTYYIGLTGSGGYGDLGAYNLTLPAGAVPEPTTLILMTAVFPLLMKRRRRRTCN